MGKTIGVLSLKGGVGKTSTVVSLGSALASMGKKVLLVDANFSAPNLGLHLNIVDPECTIHHVLDNAASAHEAVQTISNFDVLPAAIFGKSNLNYLKLRDKLKLLKRKYDFILLDSSPALNDETLAAMNASDDLLVVTTPDHPTLSTTMKAIGLAKKNGTPIIGLIINKAYGKGFELSLEDIEETSEVPVMAVIPHDVQMMKSVSRFTPIIDLKPNSKTSEEYKKLASVLGGEKYKPNRLSQFFKKILPKKQEINRAIYYERIFK